MVSTMTVTFRTFFTASYKPRTRALFASVDIEEAPFGVLCGAFKHGCCLTAQAGDSARVTSAYLQKSSHSFSQTTAMMKTTVCPGVGGFATSSDQTRLARDVALLRLRMRPPGGHVIRHLPGFLPNVTLAA